MVVWYFEMYSKDVWNSFTLSEQVWPSSWVTNCAECGFAGGTASTVRRARHCWGLIREQNDHLFLQSDEETLPRLIGAFVWGLFLGWLPDCSPAER